MRETVLVVGGAGYIGSHVCKALAASGMLPVTYDNLSRGHRWAVRWGPLEIGDLADPKGLEAVFRRHRPAAVMHFASFIEAGESVVDPAPFYVNNVANMLTLLQAMRRADVDRLVFSSSAAIFGAPRSVPITERHPVAPLSPYGRTKAFCESILRDFAAAYGMNSVSLRYFNAAGADPQGELGEAHSPETHLIPLVLEAAAGHRPYIGVFGDRYPTPDGTCVRDYIHVADLARAHVEALRRVETPDGGAYAYNLGNGRGFTVREVIDAARRVTRRTISAKVLDPRPGDPPCLVADSSLARAELGWKPVYSDLEVQVRHAWQWVQRCRPQPKQSADDEGAGVSLAGQKNIVAAGASKSPTPTS
jgi:UDP-arabinose 4-epimerase